MEKAACLLLCSRLPRRHYMGVAMEVRRDSFIVQRIQPQLLQMSLIASVEQGIFLCTTVCTTSMRALNCEVFPFSACKAGIEIISWPVCSLCSPLLPHSCSTAEFLFLLWAVYLCYAVRTVPSAFHEPRYMAIAVHNELVLSAIFYVIR